MSGNGGVTRVTWNRALITIFFATSTGKTEDIAERLASLLGCPTQLSDVDSLSAPQDFCRADAMEELHSAFQKTGARMVGSVPVDGCTFNESRSVINGRFCGLPIDEDSEPDLTDERLHAWAGS